MSSTETPPVRVRGRDFIGYRIFGAICAVLLLIALAAQGWTLIFAQDATVPEVHWGASQDGGGQVLLNSVLTERTRLLAQRDVSGPSPEGAQQDFKRGTAVLAEQSKIDDPDATLTQAWARPDGLSAAMLREPRRIEGISSLPYANAALFERPFGRDWRLGMADFVTHLGAIAILGFTLLLALVLAIRGRVPIKEGRSGRRVKRFGMLERATHWMTATSFLMLALTGCTLAFGDTLILPFGDVTLGSLGWLATWGHAIFFPPFALGVLIMILMWTHRNLPTKLDLNWLKRGGGFFSDEGGNPPARKFNAGQKLIFWAAVLGGIAMIASGVFLLFPFWFANLETTSWAMLTHAVLAMLLIAVFIGHIYIGTVGMQGAFWAMWRGDVDRNWAEEHHELWVRDELNRKGA